MKPKDQKRREALKRVEANITKTRAAIEKHRAHSNSWKKPVLTASSTASERREFMFLPQENPFLKMVELDTRRLKRLEDECQFLKNKIADAETTYRYV